MSTPDRVGGKTRRGGLFVLLSRMLWVVIDNVVGLFQDPRNRRVGNPIAVGFIGMALVLSLLAAVLTIPKGLYHLRTDAYTAEFENVAVLTEGSPVLVAGVPQGRVESLELADGHVDVRFRLDTSINLGDRTSASIGVRSVLGNAYLVVEPAGEVNRVAGGVIPLARTVSPYTLDEAGLDLREATGGLDRESATRMLEVLRRMAPPNDATSRAAITNAATALTGVAEHSAELDRLLAVSATLSGLAVKQQDVLRGLTTNGRIVVEMLASRRDALWQLAENLRRLLAATAALSADVRGDMDATVPQLESVLTTLRDQGDRIEELLRRLAPGLRAVADSTGNGPWADVVAPSGPFPDNLLCTLGVQGGCG